jgi:hypothetical protein
VIFFSFKKKNLTSSSLLLLVLLSNLFYNAQNSKDPVNKSLEMGDVWKRKCNHPHYKGTSRKKEFVFDPFIICLGQGCGAF